MLLSGPMILPAVPAFRLFDRDYYNGLSGKMPEGFQAPGDRFQVSGVRSYLTEGADCFWRKGFHMTEICGNIIKIAPGKT
jgi:hypothetical protein